jgi:hypothetical protein
MRGYFLTTTVSPQDFTATLAPNAGAQLLPEAGATQERTL